MGQVSCLYCGGAVPEEAPVCPHCGAPSHFQRDRARRSAPRRFLVRFWLLVAACLVLAVWLPR